MTIKEVLFGRIAVLTLNRPAALNAITDEMISAIETALERHRESDADAIVITGEGRAFCAGSDLKQVPRDIDDRIERMHALALNLIDHPKLSVAALNGLALGGGLELALACTFRVVTPEAKLGLPEVRLSVMPGYGGTQLLSRAVGTTRALEMLLTGDSVSGTEARAMGLVTLISDNPLGAAVTLAERCTEHGQAVQRAIRRVIYEGRQLDLKAALRLEHELNRPLSCSPEAIAAIQDFVDGATKA